MTNKGRPKSSDKLCHSINLKLTTHDFDSIQQKAAKLGLTATKYARLMTLKGVIKSRFTLEELDLLRKVAGVANNLNQITRRLNSDFNRFKIEGIAIIHQLKTIISDSKKH